MKDPLIVGRAAIAATVGFAGLAVFQLLLAAGVPWGEAAWGGSHEGTLPASLRIGSAGSLPVYAVAAALVLRRAGFPVPRVMSSVARVGTWVVTVLLALGAAGNLLSSSPWERFLLGPVTVGLTLLCLAVGRGGVVRRAEDPAAWSSTDLADAGHRRSAR